MVVMTSIVFGLFVCVCVCVCVCVVDFVFLCCYFFPFDVLHYLFSISFSFSAFLFFNDAYIHEYDSKT